MKALVWCGKNDVRVESVPDPKILNPRDALLRVTSTAICGSDLLGYHRARTAVSRLASPLSVWATRRAARLAAVTYSGSAWIS